MLKVKYVAVNYHCQEKPGASSIKSTEIHDTKNPRRRLSSDLPNTAGDGRITYFTPSYSYAQDPTSSAERYR